MTAAFQGEEFAPAKINLTLQIVGRRPDRYHQLESVVAFANIGDRLGLTVTGANHVLDSIESNCALEYTGAFGATLAQAADANLIEKACRSYKEYKFPQIKPQLASSAAKPPYFHWHFHWKLQKNLPIAAGVGGGSSDAAAALRLLEQWAQSQGMTPSPRHELLALAANLGSDVPVCLFPEPSRMQERGEKISPYLIDLPPKTQEKSLGINVILFNPSIALATKAVFAEFARERQIKGRPDLPQIFDWQNMPPPDPPHIRSLDDFCRLAVWQNNHLADVACRLAPDLHQFRRAIERQRDILGCFMTGSGATLVGICASPEAAHIICQNLRREFPNAWVEACQITPSPSLDKALYQSDSQ
ncbi:MAG: 4-(cytidine 5'-diphospho)-2-C-methyl-D-erythritol kinase [Alphaproteobacteria bacterium]|nr:4-(cytidine 5'-diphospho)-2-C-methyl-D-erythritol kinase [Alphaproteobacteria bacterium]